MGLRLGRCQAVQGSDMLSLLACGLAVFVISAICHGFINGKEEYSGS